MWIGWLIAACLAIGCGKGASDSPETGTGDGDGDGDGDGAGYQPEPFEPTAATRAYCGGSPSAADAVEERITGLLGQMTLVQKVSLMSGARGVTTDGVWLVEGISSLGIPGMHMLDGPRGVSSMAEVTATNFPVAMLRGATWAPELERRVGAAIARELNATGADVLLAPTINVLRHPRWGRAQETYSEDVHHMGEMAVAFVQGAQSEPVIASVKHFAVNSIEDTRNEVDVTVDERTLREIYLPHFRRVVQEAQVGSVMSAYNSVNGFYCDLNKHLLTDILKNDWEFQGFVESDWYFGTHGDVASVRAGLDIEMPAGANFNVLAKRVQDGDIQQTEIDASVRRILRAQFCAGLDVSPPTREPAKRETAEHVALALEVAQRGIVLLKNNGALPFDSSAVGEVVVLGRLSDAENTGDVGSSEVVSTDVVTALEGIVDRAGEAAVTHIGRAVLTESDEATVAAAGAAVVVVGLDATLEGEGFIGAGDRESLALLSEEIALIRAVGALNPRTVVVLEGGGAIEVAPWLDDVAAVAMAWYPGQQGGNAIADVLFGNVNPSGRLPMSFPVAEADLPVFDNESLEVTYDYFHGYRYLQRNGTPAQFPFGFGLSYTSFALADPDATLAGDTVDVSVEVTNTGSRAGVETVQVYATAVGSRVERAPADLRGFGQVELQPGETATVEVSFPTRDLAFYDVEAEAWEIEALTYEIRVGTNSRDLLPPVDVSVP